MSQNFSDKSNNPNENQAEIESLVAAFFTERPPQPSRAETLWRQLEPRLEAAPVRRSLFGSWFQSANMARNNTMQTETPLFDQDEEIPAKPPRRRTLATSLMGGLAALILVAGLILVVSLATGSKAPVSGPPVGSQGQNPVAAPTPTLPPTSTPLPFNGTPVAGMVDPNATPTPPPYRPTTPGTNGPVPTTVPATAIAPTGTTLPGNGPTVIPNGSPTPTPWDGTSPISPTVVPGATPTQTPADIKPTRSTDPNAKIPLEGADNVAVRYLQQWPVAFNLNALPPLVRATNPTMSYYGATQDGSTVLAEVHAALVAKGYKYVSADGSAATAPQWQPTGLAAFYTKVGQPDLYITFADLPTTEEVKQYLANGFDNGIISYEKVTEDLRTMGFKTVVMITSAHNLLQVMRDGQDPGTGSPTVTPPPTK